MKYLRWLFILIKATIFRKAIFIVSFTKEANDKWYVDFPNWPLSHDNLEMVAGADDLLDILNDDTDHVRVEVKLKQAEGIQLTKVHSALTKGAFYTVDGVRGWENPNTIRRKQLWLCPVTLTVLGHYPKHLTITTFTLNKEFTEHFSFFNFDFRLSIY